MWRRMKSSWNMPGDFSMGSDEYYALLGSPNENCQAWIFINHKEALGTNPKTVSKVRISSN